MKIKINNRNYFLINFIKSVCIFLYLFFIFSYSINISVYISISFLDYIIFNNTNQYIHKHIWLAFIYLFFSYYCHIITF